MYGIKKPKTRRLRVVVLKKPLKHGSLSSEHYNFKHVQLDVLI